MSNTDNKSKIDKIHSVARTKVKRILEENGIAPYRRRGLQTKLVNALVEAALSGKVE